MIKHSMPWLLCITFSILCAVPVTATESAKSKTVNEQIGTRSYAGSTKVITESFIKAEEKIKQLEKKQKQREKIKKIWKQGLKEVGYVNGTNLNIRKQPNTNSAIVNTLSFNSKIEYTQINDNWGMIKYNNNYYYISIDYLSDKPYVAPPKLTLPYSSGEIALLKNCVLAECGYGEPDLGVRLVVDVIINRTKSSKFPNTITGVITQPHQFSSYTDGNMSKCRGKTTEQIDRIISEELVNQTNSQVLYFTAGGYNRSCIPMFAVGHHYFGR